MEIESSIVHGGGGVRDLLELVRGVLDSFLFFRYGCLGNE